MTKERTTNRSFLQKREIREQRGPDVLTGALHPSTSLRPAVRGPPSRRILPPGLQGLTFSLARWRPNLRHQVLMVSVLVRIFTRHQDCDLLTRTWLEPTQEEDPLGMRVHDFGLDGTSAQQNYIPYSIKDDRNEKKKVELSFDIYQRWIIFSSK